jgi:hypothetical protein
MQNFLWFGVAIKGVSRILFQDFLLVGPGNLQSSDGNNFSE